MSKLAAVETYHVLAVLAVGRLYPVVTAFFVLWLLDNLEANAVLQKQQVLTIIRRMYIYFINEY